MTDLVFEFLAPFGGSGGQSLGLLAEEVRLLGHVGRFRCRGSIDIDPIGNSIPPPAAAAIGRQMLVALMESAVGAMSLSSLAFWV